MNRIDPITFIRDPQLIGGDLSFAQEIAIRMSYGMTLTEEQAALARTWLDRDDIPQREFPDNTFIFGRRAGKSERLAANMAVYEAATGDHARNLARGERAHIVLINQDTRAAQVMRRFILGKLENSPVLSQLIQDARKEEIDLTNRVTISIFPCSFRAPRGFSIPVAVLDEVGVYRVEGANVDKEVVDAIRPAMAMFPRPKLIKISSPYGKQGELWRDYTSRKQRPDLLCFRAESWVMNPSIPKSFLDQERERDAEYFAREYEAQFSDSLTNAFAREAIEACLCVGRYELPPSREFTYIAAVDPSGGGADEFTLAIAHREGDRLVQDVIRGWRAKQPHSVVAEAAELLRGYRITTIVGDRYSGQWVVSAFAEHGIRYQAAERTASDAFLELLPLVNQGRVELLDDKLQTNQLVNLERRSGRSGKDSLGHPRGGHDDRANALALLAAQVTRKRPGWRVHTMNYFTGEVQLINENGVIKSSSDFQIEEELRKRLARYHQNPSEIEAASLFHSDHPERLRWKTLNPTPERDAPVTSSTERNHGK